MPSALAVANTPILDALKRDGAFSDQAITHPVTHTAACWSSMFTGVWGDKHGVNDPGNSFSGNRFDVYPNFMRRLETVLTDVSTVAFLRWAPLSTALAGTDLVQVYSSDAAIVTAACDLLTNANPDVFYTILVDVDTAGHNFGWGPAVTNYVRAIETADSRIGQIISALTSRTTYGQEDWLVIVLSDHGEHDSTLERSRLTFHLVWGPGAARDMIYPIPSIVDVCATVLAHMGVTPDPAWKLDARVEGLPLPAAGYGTNLIFNGDAEFNSGTDNYTPDRGIAWWWDHQGVTLGIYGAHPNFPPPSSPGPLNRGANFFLGAASPTLVSQMIDLSGFSADIDDPGVNYVLSGWFGGFGAENDSASLAAHFLDGAGMALGSVEVGGVTATERGGVTGLLERTCGGTLPLGTRRVEFVMSFQASSGANDGSADNLSFVLSQEDDPPFSILSVCQTSQGFGVEFESRSNRQYALERSEDLARWELITPFAGGTAASMSVTDTHPPPSRAFYRVRCLLAGSEGSGCGQRPVRR